MVRALSITLVSWAMCAYSMYAYRQVQLEKAEAHSVNETPGTSSHLRKINKHAEQLYGLSPTWVGRGRFEIEGDPASFEVLFMTVPSRPLDNTGPMETSFLGRMFLNWRGKTFDIVDDSQYAGELILSDGNYYLHWRMPAELGGEVTAVLATMPEGDHSHFRLQRPNSTWAQSSYIQWQKLDDVQWFATFDRQLAQVEPQGN